MSQLGAMGEMVGLRPRPLSEGGTRLCAARAPRRSMAAACSRASALPLGCSRKSWGPQKSLHLPCACWPVETVVRDHPSLQNGSKAVRISVGLWLGDAVPSWAVGLRLVSPSAKGSCLCGRGTRLGPGHLARVCDRPLSSGAPGLSV